MSPLYHISDTVQISKYTSEHDTTISRISIVYEALIQHLNIEIDGDIIYIGSGISNSTQTAAQTLCVLLNSNFQRSQTIMVNNASRAKHKDVKDAKGSDCLWLQIEINNVTHDIVGVDDEVFAILLHFKKQNTHIRKVIGLQESTSLDLLPIEDFSKGTQFRSKEHFPLVQLIIEKNKQVNNGELDLGILAKQLKIVDYYLDKSHTASEVEGFISEAKNDLPNIERNGGVIADYKKEYLSGFESIELVQLIGELFRIKEKYGFEYSRFFAEDEVPSPAIKKYRKTRSALEKNQIAIIDRDKYGNTKCTYTNQNKTNNLVEFCELNELNIEDEVKVISSEGEDIFTAHITQSLGKRTGKKCIWQGSSKGADGENLLEINRSFDHTHTKLEEIQGLPIGSILTIIKK